MIQKRTQYIINHILYTLIQFSWGLIQNTLGVLLALVLLMKNPKRTVRYYHGAFVIHWGRKSSMGLGMFIFFGHERLPGKYASRILVHEYGHTIQSCILGPLYLPVIGLPSSTWAFLPCFDRMRREKNISYYDFYPEAWANYEGERILKKVAPPNTKAIKRRKEEFI